jgi:hypothetical protein
MLIDAKEVAFKDVISFTTINDSDQITYQGIVKSLSMSSEIASRYNDVYSYNQKIKKTSPSVGEIEDHEFFLLQYEQDGSTLYKAFAKEWITPDSLIIIDQTQYLDVRIFNILEGQHDALLLLLRDNGYTVKKTS